MTDTEIKNKELNNKTVLSPLTSRLTEDEVALLFDYRLASEEQRKEIQKFIANLQS